MRAALRPWTQRACVKTAERVPACVVDSRNAMDPGSARLSPIRFGDSAMTKQHGITGLLIEWRDGDVQALERLVPLVYDELRKVARAQLRRENVGHSLQATAL